MKKYNSKVIIIVGFVGSLIASYALGKGLKLNKQESEANKSIISSDFKLEDCIQITKTAPFEIVDKCESPVLKKGNMGEWDSIDLLNPSVVEIEGKYYNYYSGYDGEKWSTGVAMSDDGVEWDKYENNPVITLSDSGWDSSYIAANGSAVYYKENVYYFYQGNDENGKTQIGLAISEDKVNFEKEEAPVITCGENGEWDCNGVADPYVIEHKGNLYMYYLGMNELGVQRLGVAVSNDGINWVKSNANPILDVGAKGSFDENGLGEPSVYYSSPFFYMLYTGRDADEIRNIGLAYSLDGVNWYKENYNGLIELKNDAWDSKVICDTTFLYNDTQDLLYVWYGGGNEAEPAENLNGNVGVFTVDISQNRDMYNWDSDADWSNSKAKSTDVLKGSYEIEDGQAWVSEKVSVDLKNSVESDKISINGYMPLDNYKKIGIEIVKLSIYIDNKFVVDRKFTQDGVFEIEISKSQLGITDENEYFNITIISDSYVVPKEILIGDDERKLAWVVYSVLQK